MYTNNCYCWRIKFSLKNAICDEGHDMPQFYGANFNYVCGNRENI